VEGTLCRGHIVFSNFNFKFNFKLLTTTDYTKDRKYCFCQIFSFIFGPKVVRTFAQPSLRLMLLAEVKSESNYEGLVPVRFRFVVLRGRFVP